MPYIIPEQRDQLDPVIDKLTAVLWEYPADNKDGMVNYITTRLLHSVYQVKVRPSYFAFNRALGVLEAVKLELYRRHVADYETAKWAENGDV